MIAFVVRYLGGPFGVVIMWAVISLFVALVGIVGVQYVEKAALRADVATLKGEKAQLEASVSRQNAAVEDMAKGCQAEADAAVAQALRALNSPPPPAPGTGPEHLNRWLKDRTRAR